MTDDELGSVEVTGRWIGFYRHRWEQLGTYPIVAEIHQFGNTITGEMYDQITERSNSLVELAEILRSDMPSNHRHKLDQAIGQYGSELVVSSQLPDRSDIQGKITGSQVMFTKSYRGAMEYTWTVGEKAVWSLRQEKHKVEYSGHLDREQFCIAGRWIIGKKGLLRWVLPPAAWGTFELYKKS